MIKTIIIVSHFAYSEVAVSYRVESAPCILARMHVIRETNVREVSTPTMKNLNFFWWNRLVVVWWSLGGSFRRLVVKITKTTEFSKLEC